MFFDLGLGVNPRNESLARKCKRESIRRGYQAVACCSGGSQDESPANQRIHLGHPDADMQKSLRGFSDLVRPAFLRSKELTQLSRVTIVAHSASVLEDLPTARSQFDIVAIEPQSSDVLSMACRALDVDIVVLNFESSKFPISTDLCKIAQKRGIYFELLYSAVLRQHRDGDLPTNYFCATQSIVKKVGQKSFIISSGALHPREIKDPETVIAIAIEVFGFERDAAEAAISTSPAAVIKHAIEARRRGFELIKC